VRAGSAGWAAMAFAAGRGLFYHSRKGRKLFFKIIAAAFLTKMSGVSIRFFQKFAYLAAVSAFIFKNWHKNPM
jgi:hypothetical protein